MPCKPSKCLCFSWLGLVASSVEESTDGDAGLTHNPFGLPLSHEAFDKLIRDLVQEKMDEKMETITQQLEEATQQLEKAATTSTADTCLNSRNSTSEKGQTKDKWPPNGCVSCMSY